MAVTITYYPRLYLGESISRKKLDKIKRRLEKKPLLSGVFLLTLSTNATGQLEIYKARLLAEHYYRENPPYVIGIAKTYDEAVAIVEQIVAECLQARGDCMLKEYLLCSM